AWSKSVAQRSQLLASSHSPWMKTTGVRADEFAASTCPDSRAVSVAMPANLAAPSSAGSEAAAPRYHQPPWPSSWMAQSPTSKGASRLQHEEERSAEGRVSSSAGRRKDQRTGRLAGQDPLQASRPNQTGRPRSGRGVEVEKGHESRGSGVVTPRRDLHRRDVQERREADVLQGGLAEGPFGTVQLEPRRQ